MENQLFYGSICLSDLLEQAKQKHSAFTKAQRNLDNVLCEMGMEEYMPVKMIEEMLKLNEYEKV